MRGPPGAQGRTTQARPSGRCGQFPAGSAPTIATAAARLPAAPALQGRTEPNVARASCSFTPPSGEPRDEPDMRVTDHLALPPSSMSRPGMSGDLIRLEG